MKQITITCTEKQAMLIEVALDTLSRMVAGQLHTMINGMDYIKGNCFESINDNGEKMMGYKLGSYIEDLIKPILFPELDRNASYGVGQYQIGDAQIAYEMVKKLQNFRVRNKKDAGVLKYEPLHYSIEPLIEVNEK